MQHLYRLGLCAAALALLLTSSCATIFSGTRDDVYFTSEPSGALVRIDGREVGYTPCVVPVKRRLDSSSRWVEYDLPGYELRGVPFNSEFNWVAVINILWWPGILVDAASGALMRSEYDTYFLELKPEQGK